MTEKVKSSMIDEKILLRAIKDSFIKLNPKTQAKNPVMLLVYVSAILTTILWIAALAGTKDAPTGYTPVSYTHLGLCIGRASLLPTPSHANIPGTFSVTSVSYTQLDVYKRQR